MKYSSNLAEYCSLSQSNVTGQVYVEQEHVFIIIPNSVLMSICFNKELYQKKKIKKKIIPNSF